MNPPSSPSRSSGVEPPADVSLRLDGPLTIASVENWRPRLVEALTCATAAVDLAAVRDVDVFGLQLLRAARRSAESRGVTLRLLGAGAPVLDACKAAGVDPVALGLPTS